MDPREFPTKGNLMLAKNSLMLARQGYDLMDKKRNILLKELMGLIDEAKDIQEEIDATFTKAYACLQRANIEHGISKVQELAFTVPIEDSLKMQTRSPGYEYSYVHTLLHTSAVRPSRCYSFRLNDWTM